jgi:hypothetical protein
MTDESSAMARPYQIVSVRRAEPPPGGEGSYWYRYVIAFEGTNTVHGCRQGGLKAVTRAVEEIVAQLNERHLGHSTKPSRVHLVLKKKTRK